MSNPFHFRLLPQFLLQPTIIVRETSNGLIGVLSCGTLRTPTSPSRALSSNKPSPASLFGTFWTLFLYIFIDIRIFVLTYLQKTARQRSRWLFKSCRLHHPTDGRRIRELLYEPDYGNSASRILFS